MLPAYVRAGLRLHEFNALAWLAYGGRRVGKNAYAIRHCCDEPAECPPAPDVVRDRQSNVLMPCDLPCSWPDFAGRAALFFRDRVHAHTLRRSRFTRQYTEPSIDE